MKILILGLALYAVIPVSVHVSQLIYNTYQESIDTTLSETENLVSRTEDAADAQGFIDKAKDTIDKAKETISGATEQFKYMLNKFVDGLAVLIVTTCLIPILVMIFFVWIVKIILSTAITQPGSVVPKIMQKNKENQE